MLQRVKNFGVKFHENVRIFTDVEEILEYSLPSIFDSHILFIFRISYYFATTAIEDITCTVCHLLYRHLPKARGAVSCVSTNSIRNERRFTRESRSRPYSPSSARSFEKILNTVVMYSILRFNFDFYFLIFGGFFRIIFSDMNSKLSIF